MLETIKKRCLTVGRQSRDLRPRSRDRSATFFKKISICLKRRKTLFESRPTVAWPQPLSRDRSATFFLNFPKLLETSKKRCLTFSRRSRDLRPLSRDRSTTFFKYFYNCLKRLKTLFDSRPMFAWPPTTLARHHILPRRCISRFFIFLLFYYYYYYY